MRVLWGILATRTWLPPLTGVQSVCEAMRCSQACMVPETYHEGVMRDIGHQGLAASADRDHDLLLPGGLQHSHHVEAQPLVRCRPLRLCHRHCLHILKAISRRCCDLCTCRDSRLADCWSFQVMLRLAWEAEIEENRC